MLSISSKANRSRPSFLGLVALLCLTAGSSMATISVTAGVDNTLTDNVLFNTVGLINDALMVTGTVNNGPLSLVQFTGTEILHTNGGQALITAADGSYNYLAIEIPANSFLKLVFNLNTPNGGQVSGNAQILVNGSSQGLFAIANGSNFFTLTATGIDVMHKVEILTTGTDLIDTRQIRIGGVVADAPEPGTFLTLGAGMAGLALIGWRRRRAAR